MQIQRIQSLYIFLAVVAMAIFIIVPYGQAVDLTANPAVTEKLYTMSEYGLLIPSCVVVILLLAGLFLYRNLSLQRTVVMVTLMLTLATIAVVCFALFKMGKAEGLEASFTVWDILLPIAAFLEIMAVSGINHDIKLLKSYDRLR
ncbi:MAG: DUF4293 domain-containing protein [Duncaniella sp.]|nr:DUF4293 domain-containing protein [Duncaniella sp.]MDE6466557.1 DUF4293 domain-containing protein [Duncaniella sp.]MDE6572753.1 DUF4293 domain-containing protein [Duncaniella sp.]